MAERILGVATIRASVLNSLVRTLDREGGSTDLLLTEHGLVRAYLDDPYALVPLGRYVALYERAAQVLGDPGLGLRLGIGVRPSDLGPLGLLFTAAPTLGSAFARLTQFLLALQSATHVGLQHNLDFTSWTYRIADPDIWPRVQDAEFSLAAACQLARGLVGTNWRPLEVHFEHDEPRNRAALDRYFQAPLRFRQQANRLLVAATDIDRAIRKEDRELTRILERHIGDLVAGQPNQAALTDRVRDLISVYLGQERVTIEKLAQDLGLSRRTLQRELGREGTSVRQLLHEYRLSFARQRIKEGRLANTALAHALGFADETVFWRAFKSWTGMTPTAHRRNLKAGES
jgi:AraC-like DNA-binding protein